MCISLSTYPLYELYCSFCSSPTSGVTTILILLSTRCHLVAWSHSHSCWSQHQKSQFDNNCYEVLVAQVVRVVVAVPSTAQLIIPARKRVIVNCAVNTAVGISRVNGNKTDNPCQKAGDSQLCCSDVLASPIEVVVRFGINIVRSLPARKREKA